MSTIVKEAFKDYKENGNILECRIDNVNLYKKSKKLEIELSSDNEINLSEIYIFEEYLKNKFQVKNVTTNIKYNVENDILGASKDTPEEVMGTPLILGRSEKIKEKIIKIADLNLDYGKVAIEGEVVSVNSRELKNGKILATYNIYDGTSTITCKSFLEIGKAENVLSRISHAKRLRILGNVQYDSFAKEIGIISNVIVEVPQIEKNQRNDLSKEKRVELHLHTQMSQMDGISSATSLIKRAASWGMDAIAITDHGVVQAFPEANKAAKDEDIKVIYGVEAYLVSDDRHAAPGGYERPTLLDNIRDLDTYIVFDIETTGLAFRTEKITEIRSNKSGKWQSRR